MRPERCAVCGCESDNLLLVNTGRVDADGVFGFAKGPACRRCVHEHASIAMDLDARNLLEGSVSVLFENLVARMMQQLSKPEERIIQ